MTITVPNHHFSSPLALIGRVVTPVLQWCLPLHAATIFCPARFPELPPDLVAALTSLDAVLELYKELDIDPAEFACLKAIILFKPGGENDKSQWGIINYLLQPLTYYVELYLLL